MLKVGFECNPRHGNALDETSYTPNQKALNQLYEYFKELENDRLSFIFNGDVSDDITDGIIRITEYNVNNFEALAKLSRRISFIMVECFQNVVRHGAKADNEANEKAGGLFAARLLGDANYVSSINMIDAEEVKLLSQKLNQLNSIEKDKLKALYLEVLNNEEISTKGGAGLGLIQLARKAGQPISFDFQDITEELSNFYLSLKLTTNEVPTKQGEALRFTKDFDSKIKDSNVVMIYKGDFGKDSILPIIQIIEEKMKSDNEGGSKAFFLILVELLQNVSRHNIRAEGKEGIFMITEDEDGAYWTSVGNVVDGATKAILAEKISNLNAMEPLDLKAVYKKTLREGSFSDKGGAGLGLIEIARKSSEKLGYSFDDMGSDEYFFTFNVKF
ncbi:MAG: SiaB family protein kinase [Flavobacteriales bacterium]